MILGIGIPNLIPGLLDDASVFLHTETGSSASGRDRATTSSTQTSSTQRSDR